MLLFPAINATRAGSLVENDFVKAGQLIGQLFPEPAGHQLDGWIFQAGNVIEIGVIELCDDWPHCVGNGGMIVKDARGLVDGTSHRDGDLEAVTMDVAALMAGGKLGQRLG